MRVRNLAAIAGALMLSASATAAMDVGNFNVHQKVAAPDTTAVNYSRTTDAPATEEVIVTAPNIRMQRGTVFGLPGKATLSRSVAFNDLDLRETADARTLRQRVRDTAREICDTLEGAQPQREASGTSCYRDALNDAMPRTNAAIREARTR